MTPWTTAARPAAGAIAASALLVACATSPLGRSQLMLVSNEQIQQMGVDTFQQIVAETPQSDDPQVRAYVTCVANAITEAIPADAEGVPDGAWEVRVFADDTANAFALPGGKIGVHAGLLDVAENADQLATVIGHEVAHVLAGHSAERVSAQMAKELGVSGAQVLLGAAGDPSSPYNGLLLQALGVSADLGVLKYSRTHESEADLYGLDLMARAGFDPRASVPLWRNMDAAGGGRPPEFLSTHPSPETRIEDLQKRIPRVLPTMEQARAQGRRPRCQPPG